MTRGSVRLFVLFFLGAWLAGGAPSKDARALLAAGFAQAAGEAQKEEPNGHELLFKVINFAVLVGALAYLLRKPLNEFLAERSASIRKALEEGRKALEASQAQLLAVEEKLRRLEEEIAVFKASARREMEAERQRLRKAAAEEAERILEAGRARFETAVRAAKQELKIQSAQEALRLAERLVREQLDDAGRQRLVSQFVSKLQASGRGN